MPERALLAVFITDNCSSRILDGDQRALTLCLPAKALNLTESLIDPISCPLPIFISVEGGGGERRKRATANRLRRDVRERRDTPWHSRNPPPPIYTATRHNNCNNPTHNQKIKKGKKSYRDGRKTSYIYITARPSSTVSSHSLVFLVVSSLLYYEKKFFFVNFRVNCESAASSKGCLD